MTDEQIIRKFAARVLYVYSLGNHDDISALAVDEILTECGLVEPSRVNEEDMKDGWPEQWCMRVGDSCERNTELAKTLIKEGNQYAKKYIML